MVGRLGRRDLLQALESVAKPIVTGEVLSPETRSIRTKHFTLDMRTKILDHLDGNERELRRIALDEDHGMAARFAALYGALHLLRREGDVEQYQQLVTEAQPTFGQLPLFETFYAFFHQFAGDLQEAFHHAVRALDALPEMPGAQHLHAEIVADLLDRSEDVDDQVVSAALQRIEAAIQSGNASSPAFQETFARLLLHTGAHERARQAINAALSLESPSEPGYQLRVTNRRMIRKLIDHDQKHSEHIDEQSRLIARQAELIDRMRATYEVLRGEHEEVREDMSKIRTDLYGVRDQTLTLLALFAAVIAFVVTTVQVSVSLDVVSVMVVTVLLGMLTITIFSSASVVLGLSARKSTIGILVISTGASIALLGLAVTDVIP